MAGPKPLRTEFDIHHVLLESWLRYHQISISNLCTLYVRHLSAMMTAIQLDWCFISGILNYLTSIFCSSDAKPITGSDEFESSKRNHQDGSDLKV